MNPFKVSFQKTTLTNAEELIKSINSNIELFNTKCHKTIQLFPSKSYSSYQHLLIAFDDNIAKEIEPSLSSFIDKIQLNVSIIKGMIDSGELEMIRTKKTQQYNELVNLYQQITEELAQLKQKKKEQDTQYNQNSANNNQLKQILKDLTKQCQDIVIQHENKNEEITKLCNEDDADIIFLRTQYLSSIHKDIKSNTDINVKEYIERLQLETKTIKNKIMTVKPSHNSLMINQSLIITEEALEEDNRIEEQMKKIEGLIQIKKDLKQQIESEKKRITEELSDENKFKQKEMQNQKIKGREPYPLFDYCLFFLLITLIIIMIIINIKAYKQII